MSGRCPSHLSLEVSGPYSIPYNMSSPPPQQINVADLDVPQLADVRRQLEEVRLLMLQSRVANTVAHFSSARVRLTLCRSSPI